ncbi:hypothetical protein diail_3128 [Diaporthe ilicicola]|nr:hypothetical protein diail_3128 [Diaporthe ilicicola]
MGSFTLAAGTALLALGVKAQMSYQGCAALDTSNAKVTTEIYPQSPAACLAFCNSQGIGYTYAGITAQFCSCWVSAPVVTKQYADSAHADCSFNCDDPNANQYCGGIDLTTLGFLYSYYAGVAPVVNPGGPFSNSSSSTTGADVPTVIATPPATSDAGTATATPASTTDVGSVIPTQPTQSSGPSDVSVPPSQSTSSGGGLPSTGPGAPESSGGSSSQSTSPGVGLPSTGPGAPGSSGGSPSQSPSSPGGIVPTSSGSSTPSPSATAGIGGAPIVTVVVLIPGQAFTISLVPYLRNATDQALSYLPSPSFLLYNANIKSFFGIVPSNQPLGPLVITVTAGQPTTGVGRRQVPTGVYTFAIEIIIVAPGVSSLPPGATSSLTSLPPGVTTTSGAVLPSYTNTIYQTVTSTITRCPVCAPEVTSYRVPVGTTCVTAQVFTTPCPVTIATTRPNGKVIPTVITTLSKIPYNPAESTCITTTYMDKTTKYTTTQLVPITYTVQKLQPTGSAGAVQPPPPPPAGGAAPAAPPAAAPPAAAPPAAAPPAAAPPAAAPPAAAPPAAAPPAAAPPAAAPPAAAPPAAAPPAAAPPAAGVPAAGPVAPAPAPAPNGAVGTGAANNGPQPAKPTTPVVTAGASMDRFVEMFVLLCGLAFGALLVL